MPQFSPELLKQIKEYFKSHYEKALTDEEVSLYLDSLANLYILWETHLSWKISKKL